MSAQEVMIAEGTLGAGFHRPVELSAGASGSFSDLQVTLSAPDIGYVVWAQQPATQLRLSVICNGKIVVADRQLLGDAVPLALFPLTGGRAALVFDRYGDGTPLLQYAVLSATGTIGAIAKIAHPGTRDTEATELSVNSRGELIASWVHDDLAAPPGSSPASAGFVAAKLVVVGCKPALRCAPPQTVPLGDTKPACIDPTVAISPDGTSTVIAAAHDWGTIGCDDQLGIWASVTHGNATTPEPARRIGTDGGYPLAEPVGDAGTEMVFNPGPASSDSFASSFLSLTGAMRMRASPLDSGGYWNTGQQSLDPAIDGWYLIVWTHANPSNSAQLSIRAALGHDEQVGPASTAVNQSTDQYVGATGGHGDAIILFNGSTGASGGAPWPYSSGLYATVLRR